MSISRSRFSAVLTAFTLLSIGLAIPSAQAAPAAAEDCAASHKDAEKITATRTVVIRPKPVKSEAGALDQINKHETVTSVRGHWDKAAKKCVNIVTNGEKQDVCGSGDPTTWYYTVWVKQYKRIGYVPAGCFWG